MVYKRSRVDEIASQRQFEEALNLAMHHTGVNYSEALELVFTPLRDQGGLSVADYVRRGQLPQAKRALVELIDNQRRSAASSRLAVSSRGL